MSLNSPILTSSSPSVPPRWTVEPTDKQFAQGSDGKVDCKADGFPKPQIGWKKAPGNKPENYQDLDTNVQSNVKVIDGALVMKNIQKENEGYYLCKSTNGIGRGLSAVIYISVQGKNPFRQNYFVFFLYFNFQHHLPLRSRQESRQP